jgi:hypothetical protein
LFCLSTLVGADDLTSSLGLRTRFHEHAELALYQDEIIATVRAPGHRSTDSRHGRERYHRIGLGPSRWLFAVVNFNETPARIVTAYGNRKDPPGWTTQ